MKSNKFKLVSGLLTLGLLAAPAFAGDSQSQQSGPTPSGKKITLDLGMTLAGGLGAHYYSADQILERIHAEQAKLPGTGFRYVDGARIDTIYRGAPLQMERSTLKSIRETGSNKTYLVRLKNQKGEFKTYVFKGTSLEANEVTSKVIKGDRVVESYSFEEGLLASPRLAKLSTGLALVGLFETAKDVTKESSAMISNAVKKQAAEQGLSSRGPAEALKSMGSTDLAR